jgi:glycosyltransferase involved in cell wall biosynthesis
MSEEILKILHVFSTFQVGGPQNRFVQIANHFGRKYRHLIIAMDGAADALSRLSPDIDVKMITVTNRRGAFLSNVAAFRNDIRRLVPNVMVTSNWGTIEWAFANTWSRVRHLHLEDGFGPDEVDSQKARRVLLRRFALRRATVVLPSIVLYQMAKKVWRLPPERIVHIPNGVDCERFRTTCDRSVVAAYGINPGLPVIGTVAGLRPEKNLERLVEAFARVLQRRPAQLVIVGDGPERARLQACTTVLGIADRTFFLGMQANPEKFLACFDLFALSSDTEQMPLSVLEAMAAGLPIAATDVGDIKFMVTEGNRRFIVKPNVETLADAICSLMDNGAMASTLGMENAQRADQVFSDQKMFEAYGNLFDGQR